MTSAERRPVKLRPEIVALPPYKQGKPAPVDAYKLSSNENPYPPLDGVIEDVVRATSFNRYPDATALAVREVLAERNGVSVDEVHIGAGSVSIISQLISAAAGAGDEVVYPWRSFEAYPGLVTVAGATSVQVPLKADDSLDLPALAEAVTERTRVVIVCSPNNPTGTVVGAAEFADFMDSIPDDLLVLLDEAYYEFIDREDAVDGLALTGRYPNLVVLHTFSKAYGLAGLRIGWAIGPVDILNAARASAIPLSVTEPSQVAALASLERDSELAERVSHIRARRNVIRDGFLDRGLRVPEAQGNFIWLGAGDETDRVQDVLFSHGIVARAFPGSGVRISIGEEESIVSLFRAADEIAQLLPAAHPLSTLG